MSENMQDFVNRLINGAAEEAKTSGSFEKFSAGFAAGGYAGDVQGAGGYPGFGQAAGGYPGFGQAAGGYPGFGQAAGGQAGGKRAAGGQLFEQADDFFETLFSRSTKPKTAAQAPQPQKSEQTVTLAMFQAQQAEIEQLKADKAELVKLKDETAMLKNGVVGLINVTQANSMTLFTHLRANGEDTSGMKALLPDGIMSFDDVFEEAQKRRNVRLVTDGSAGAGAPVPAPVKQPVQPPAPASAGPAKIVVARSVADRKDRLEYLLDYAGNSASSKIVLDQAKDLEKEDPTLKLLKKGKRSLMQDALDAFNSNATKYPLINGYLKNPFVEANERKLEKFRKHLTSFGFPPQDNWDGVGVDWTQHADA